MFRVVVEASSFITRPVIILIPALRKTALMINWLFNIEKANIVFSILACISAIANQYTGGVSYAVSFYFNGLQKDTSLAFTIKITL